ARKTLRCAINRCMWRCPCWARRVGNWCMSVDMITSSNVRLGRPKRAACQRRHRASTATPVSINQEQVERATAQSPCLLREKAGLRDDLARGDQRGFYHALTCPLHVL